MQVLTIGREITARLRWPDAVDALRHGHTLPKAEVGDLFLGDDRSTSLTRAARIGGLGYGVKSVTVFPDNPAAGIPSIHGAMFVFEPDHGRLAAIIDSAVITEFKTAADSVLGAQLLARADSRTLLIIGAGAVARSLVAAYAAAFPGLTRMQLWSRRPEQAGALAAEIGEAAGPDGPICVEAVTDLETAVGAADMVATATMAREPVLHGAWVQPGTHVDLIGAFKPDMREGDDALMADHALFVDSRETTIGHIGELMIPIASGVITAHSVRGDLYELVSGAVPGRMSDSDVTVFKNGGGAHLDLMMARYIIERANAAD